MLTQVIKKRLAAGRPVIGSWLTFAEPAVAEIMARAGFDWLAVDMEHSGLTLFEAQELIRAVTLCEVPCLVRLPANDSALAKRVMDAGASGIIVPMINTEAEARSAVHSIKYPPVGHRSYGLARAQGYGPGFGEYVASANDDSLVVVQIEHADALDELDAILSVPGVDGLFIGPYDLSGSIGVPGQLDHPKVVDAVDRILQASRLLGVPAGLHVVDPAPEEVASRIEQGFTLLAYSVDFLLLGETCRNDLHTLRAVLGEEDQG